MKSLRPTLLAALALPALANAAPGVAAPAPASAAAEKPATPAAPQELAKVNGKAITTADVERALRTRYGSQIDAMPAEQRAMAIRQSTPQMAEELIARSLLLEAATKSEDATDSAEVQKTVDRIKGSLPPEMKFEDYLKSVNHDDASLRSEIGEELKISQHMRTKLDAIPKATEEAVTKFYEENKEKFVTQEQVQASHILLKTDPAAGEEGKKAKRAEIDKIRQQLIDAKGEGFDAIAKEHSDCPSGAQGGDLGAFGRGQMVPEFDAAAFTQKKGEIGEIVETQFGYHLIKVTNKTEAGQQSFEAVKDSISEQLDGQAQQTAVQDYLAALEKGAEITRSALLTPPAPPLPGAPPAE